MGTNSLVAFFLCFFFFSNFLFLLLVLFLSFFVLPYFNIEQRMQCGIWGRAGVKQSVKLTRKKTLRDYITTPNNDPHPSAHNFYRQTKFPPTSSNLSRGSSAASSSTSLQTCNCIYTSSAVTQADYPIPLPRRQRVPEPDPRDTALCKRRRGSAGFRRSR